MLDYEDPAPRGHSFEFRINGEDPGRNFFPAPGPVHAFNAPSGPGVRVDSGVVSGDVVSGSFDSMLAKLIVTGATRAEALERSRRALAEFEVTGLPTVLPFHRAVVSDPAFATPDDEPFSIYTQWIETDFQNDIPAWSGSPEELPAPAARDTVVVEVQGKRIEVTMPSIVGGGAAVAAGRRPAGPSAPPKRRASGVRGGMASSGSVTSPMQATVVKTAVAEGDTVVKGDLLVVLEAMKMEQPVQAPRDGVVTALNAPVGQTISSGHVLLELA